MKKKKLSMIITAGMCCIGMVSAPVTAIAEEASRDQVHDTSLVLGEEIGSTLKAINGYLHQNNIAGYASPTEDHQKIEVVCLTDEMLDQVKAYVNENHLYEEFIVYTVDETLDMTLTDGTETIPVTNDELETLVITTQKLNTFLNENGWLDDSAYASLRWNKHSVWLFVRTQEIYDKAVQFIQDDAIAEQLVDIILSPDYDYHIPDGGQKDTDEVNLIAADEYFSIKAFMEENAYLSNIYLTTKQHEDYPDIFYTCIEVYVKEQTEADALNLYMCENAFWMDVVDTTVVSDLSANSGSIVHNKAFICMSGDADDDGQFGITDVIKLQKYLSATDMISERQAYASDLTGDGCVNIFDLCLLKRKLIYST